MVRHHIPCKKLLRVGSIPKKKCQANLDRKKWICWISLVVFMLDICINLLEMFNDLYVKCEVKPTFFDTSAGFHSNSQSDATQRSQLGQCPSYLDVPCLVRGYLYEGFLKSWGIPKSPLGFNTTGGHGLTGWWLGVPSWLRTPPYAGRVTMQIDMGWLSVHIQVTGNYGCASPPKIWYITIIKPS